MRHFEIDIEFDEEGNGCVACTDIKLSRSQLKTIKSFPPYYKKLKLTGYVEDDVFCVTGCSSDNYYIGREDFYDIIYEATNTEWIINDIIWNQ